jgi:hypothetical protein
MAENYRFSVGQRVVSTHPNYHHGEVGTIIAQRPGPGANSYTVDFGQGHGVFVAEKDLRAEAEPA